MDAVVTPPDTGYPGSPLWPITNTSPECLAKLHVIPHTQYPCPARRTER